MADALIWHRLQFAFTAVYHYIFPQLTMGLALLIFLMKWRGLGGTDAGTTLPVSGSASSASILRSGWSRASDGVPVWHQLGALQRVRGKVVGHTLAMEGLFAFFLESGFIASWCGSERRVGKRGHFLASLALLAGQLALGLLHRCDQRLHAAAGRV